MIWMASAASACIEMKKVEIINAPIKIIKQAYIDLFYVIKKE